MSTDPFSDLKEFLIYHLRQCEKRQRDLANCLSTDPTNLTHMLNGRRTLFSVLQEKDIAEFLKWRRSDPEDAAKIAQLHELAENARRAYAEKRLKASPASPPRTNVAPPETPLFGRQTELDELISLLRGDTRLITLTGDGGVGKTRLALAVAWAMVGQFKDGVWFVDFWAVTEPERVPVVIAQALEESASSDAFVSPRDRLLKLAQGKEMLLVLDNFEHVMGQRLLISDLRQASARLKLLVTSRELLDIKGECLRKVNPLDVTSDYQAPHDNPGVALFVDRATSSGFQLDLRPEVVHDILELCHRLDGLPLAIELSATQLRYRGSVEGVLADIASRIQWVGERDPTARHQTLFRTIDWSYNLLSPREQWLFRTMSVFAGGMTEPVLAALEAEAPEAAPAPDSSSPRSTHLLLVDKSLLHRSDTTGSELRWRMRPITREYALLQLQKNAAEQRVARQWHADYFWRMVVKEPGPGPSLLLSPATPPRSETEEKWLRQLLGERENLWAAIDWYSREGAVERGLRLVSRLRDYWVWFGMVDEGRDYLEGFLNATDITRAEALYVAGQLAGRQGQFAQARMRYEGCLALVRQIGNKTEEARVYNDLGIVAFLEGQYDLAGQYYDHSLEIRQLLGDKEGQAKTLNNLGGLYLALKDYTRARTAIEESLALRQALRNPALIALGQNSLGDLCLAEGEAAAARAALGQCLALYVTLGRPQLDPDLLDSLSHLAFLSGRLERTLLLLAASDARRLQRPWPRSAWDKERVQSLTDAAEEAMGVRRVAELREKGSKLDDVEVMALAQAEVSGEDDKRPFAALS